MQHMVVLTANLADPSVYADLVAVYDQATNQFNNRYVFQEDRRITAAFLDVAGGGAGRITTPTLRLIQYPEIEPFQLGGAVPSLPAMNFFGDSGPVVLMNDELGVQVSTSGAGAVQAYCALWTEKDKRPASPGLTTPVRCSATITNIVNGWAGGPIAFSQQLPAGRYLVTGFTVYGTAIHFARLIFPNQPTRPGVVAFDGPGKYNFPVFRSGGMGVIGDFYTYAPPQLEVFATGAGSSQSIVMDVVKIQ